MAATAVPSRTPKDILKNVYMQVTKEGVQLVATDQEIGIRVNVEGVTSSSVGDALLPTKRLNDILREMVDESLDMSIDDQNISLKCSSGRFRLVSADAKEYPPVPEFSDLSYFKIAAPVFKNMIRRVVFATDTESTRYALGGALIEFTDDTATLAATDSRRLAVMTVACEKHGSPEIPIKTTVVPTKALQMIERAIDPKAEFVEIAVHENSVLFRSGTCTVYSRLVEGRFPKYRDVIPKKGHVTVPLPVGPFFAAVRQSQIVTDEESRGVDFGFSDSKLTISSQASSIGESKVELPIEYDSDKLNITFDPKYVADLLKVLPQEAIIDLSLIDADTAAVFRYENSYTYLIMPLARDR